MPKPTFENLPEEKRRRLIEVAEEEFAQATYDTASISRIARRAGIAKGSLYQYFENKLDLYRWLLEEAARRKLSYIEGGPAPAPGALFAWVERSLWAALRFGRDEPRAMRIAQSVYASTATPELRALYDVWRKRGLAMFRGFLEAAQADGEVRDDVDAGYAAQLMLSLLGDGLIDLLCDAAGTDRVGMLTTDALSRLSDDELARIVDTVVTILRDGLAARRPTRPPSPGAKR